jgi:hypothetical protein
MHSAVTFSVKTSGKVTFSIITFSIITFSIITFSVTIKGDIQHKL